jgi:hypothetical protein
MAAQNPRSGEEVSDRALMKLKWGDRQLSGGNIVEKRTIGLRLLENLAMGWVYGYTSF